MKKLVFIGCILLFAQVAVAGGVLRSALSETQAQGADAVILDAVAKALDVRLSIYYASFKRRLIMMENGDIDLMCGLLKRPEREGYIYFLQPPYKTRSDTVFFVLNTQQKRLAVYDDLKQFTIGVTRGTKYFPRFDRDPALEKNIEPHTVSNFRKLLLNRLDVVAVNEPLGLDLVNQLKVRDRIVTAPFRFSQKKNVYFGISRKSWMMQDLDRIRGVLNPMVESGRIRTIIAGYFHRRHLPVPAM